MNREEGRRQLLAFIPFSEESRLAQEAFLEFFDRYENAADRSLLHGHFTASAWIVSADRSAALLTHHRKLDKWIPLGGHCDGDFDFRAVALKEAREESGLPDFRILRAEPIDLHSHRIPAFGEVPEHLHHDIRFLLEADAEGGLILAEEESFAVQWVPITRLREFTSESFLIELSQRVQGLTAT